MTELIRQRLVGFAVLIFVMGVIVPWVLDHAEVDSLASESATGGIPDSIPEAVAKSSAQHIFSTDSRTHSKTHAVGGVLAEPSELHQQTKVKQIAQEAEPNALLYKPSSSGRLQPKWILLQDEHGGWLVQVGSFSSFFNAKKLLVTLTHSGLQSKMRRTVVDGHGMFRVFIGPFPCKDVAKRKVSQWQANEGKTLVA